MIDSPLPSMLQASFPALGSTMLMANDGEKAHSLTSEAASWFSAVLGPDHVLAGEMDRAIYGKSTLPSGTIPGLIVRPKNLAEVQAVVVGANRFKLKTHPISRGKNWGYGDACASTDGQLIIDLRRMDQILEINEELAYAVIEPGVTQGQLSRELVDRGSRLMLDVTGAGPDASIVGNILQRGFGHTPYGDRVANSCNYQVVRSDGSLHHTGFGDVESSHVGHVYPYGHGPDTRGHYTQANHGIVTRMTVWLMPRPETISAFAFKADSDDQLARAMDCLGRLRQSGTITSVVHVANDLRVLSTQPWMAREKLPAGSISTATRQAFRKRAGISRWNALGGIYGTRHEVRARKIAIRSAFRGICPVIVVGSKTIRLLKHATDRLPKWLVPERTRNLSSAIHEAYQLLNGFPSSQHLEGAFYRNRPESGEVIDAGLIWISPVIPCTGRDALLVTKEIETIANRHHFDLPITISPVTARAAICVTNLSFDKNNAEQVSRAIGAHEEIQRAMLRLGYPAYRTSSVPIRMNGR